MILSEVRAPGVKRVAVVLEHKHSGLREGCARGVEVSALVVRRARAAHAQRTRRTCAARAEVGVCE